MSIENFLGYESYINLMDKQLEIWGQPAMVFSPSNQTALGYEDVTQAEVEKLNVDKVLANKYSKFPTRIWINFTVEKKIFYKLNWFPEDGEELCMAVLKSDSPVKENDYIRTALPEATSIWGDMLFEVKYAKDLGIGQVLKRLYFLKPTNNADLHKELSF